MAKYLKAPKTYDRVPAKLLVYKWAGRWGPFKVKVNCGECALTSDIINDMLQGDLQNADVEYGERDWLSHMFEAKFKGAHHAPAVLLNGKVISQGVAVNRGLIAEKIMEYNIQHFPLEGTHVFGKDNCGYCTRAKSAMDEAGIVYTYHDVVKNPAALYEMVTRTKQNIGGKTPVTTPQIWIDGKYVGGYDQLTEYLGAAQNAIENVIPLARTA